MPAKVNPYAVEAGLPLLYLRYKHLAEQEREQVRTVDLPAWSGYIPHEPTRKQHTFLAVEEREALYGGSAGGGKSDGLLMAALQYADVPGYAALLLRRTFAQLSKPGALMSRAREWLANTSAVWKDAEKTWYFPGGGSLTFGYMEHAQDHFQYQSSEFQFIGFDELCQFSEMQYRYMFSRLRRLESADVPLRMRGATNPEGVGFVWVKGRFVEPPDPARPFVKATIHDNPHLNVDEYIETLQELDPITRARLLDGDWGARAEGMKFKRHWFEIVDDYPREDIRRVRYWDLAATEPKPGTDPDYTAGCLMGRAPSGITYIIDMRAERANPGEIERLIEMTAAEDGQGTDIWMEQEPGASGKSLIAHYRRNVLAAYSFHGDRVTGSKEVRANPLSSQAYAGNVKIVRGPWNIAFLDQSEGFPGGDHDDYVDAASGAYGKLNRPRFKAY